MLRRSAAGLLALGLWPGAWRAEGENQGEDFSFIAVNDLHYIDEQCGAWLRTVVAKMKECSPKPELCLVSGDFTDHGTAGELLATREIFKELGVPILGVIGNHDWRAQNDRQPYEEVFPNRLNYRHDHRGWQFLGLDTTDGLKAKNTRIPEATLQWVDAELPKLDKQRPTVLISHFPLGAKVTNRPLNADELLDRFKEHNLRAAFCGHYHAFTEVMVRDAAITTNKCCSLKKNNHDKTREKGFFFCQAKAGKIERIFVETPLPAAP